MTATNRPNSIGAMRNTAMATASRLKVNCIQYEGRCHGSKKTAVGKWDSRPRAAFISHRASGLPRRRRSRSLSR
jgi:hypothetical protein